MTSNPQPLKMMGLLSTGVKLSEWERENK